MIFAIWLCNGYYVPLSTLSPKKNIKYQINNSNISLFVHKKKGKIKFKQILNKKKKTTNQRWSNCLYYFYIREHWTKKGVIIKRVLLLIISKD